MNANRSVRGAMLAFALGALTPSFALLPNLAHGADCLDRSSAAFEMQLMRQRLAPAYPRRQAPAWYSALDQEQAQAGMRALLGTDDRQAPQDFPSQLHLLPLPDGRYLVLVGVKDQVCGFEAGPTADGVPARAAITAAENVRAAQKAARKSPYPGSPALEALYQLGLDANPGSATYPHQSCQALKYDPDLQLIPELEEMEVNNTWHGEPVTHLEGKGMTDFLFHIFGPGDGSASFTWATGMVLRPRGAQTDVILIVRDNACGFDGAASFPTDQVNRWLRTPPDNEVSFQPGDMIYMTPSQREAFQTLMGVFGGTPMGVDQLRRKLETGR